MLLVNTFHGAGALTEKEVLAEKVEEFVHGSSIALRVLEQLPPLPSQREHEMQYQRLPAQVVSIAEPSDKPLAEAGKWFPVIAGVQPLHEGAGLAVAAVQAEHPRASVGQSL